MLQQTALYTPIESADKSFKVLLFQSEQIGKGAFGQCYLGFYPRDNDIVLIKKVYKGKQNAKKFEQDYKKQVYNLSQASRKYKISEDSNIVNVYPTLIMSKNHAYIIMEYCKNGSLKDLMNVKKIHGQWFTFQQFCAMFRDILDGYKQLYGAKILHQDLKPDNIFINKGICKIGDFGLSYKLTSKKIKYAGTRDYNAPEKYESSKPSPLSDIYSLGVIFYQLIFKRHPYFTDKQFDTYYKNHRNNPENKQIKFDQIIKQEFKEANEKLQKQKIFYQFLLDCKLNNKHLYHIVVKNNQQAQTLNKIITLVQSMIALNYQHRINFQKIEQEVAKIPLSKFKPLQRLLHKKIPKKYKEIIQQHSLVEFEVLPLERYKQQIDLRMYPEIANISQSCQTLNIFTNLLYSITKSLDYENKGKKINLPYLLKAPIAIRSFNYCVTYYHWLQLLNRVSELQKGSLDIFYSSGTDYLLNNTKHNLKQLESQLIDFDSLRTIDVTRAFKQMNQFLSQQFNGIFLETDNTYSFKLITLVFDFLRLGQNFKKEQLVQIKELLNKYTVNKEHNTSAFSKQLEQKYGIDCSLVQIASDTQDM